MLLVLWRMSGIDARRVTSSAPISWQPGHQADPTLTMGDIHKTVSEGGLEPVERPLDKRVSDILSAKMDPGGPGCTPLLRIGALQERTKVAPDNDPGTKSGPGMSDPGSLVMGG